MIRWLLGRLAAGRLRKSRARADRLQRLDADRARADAALSRELIAAITARKPGLPLRAEASPTYPGLGSAISIQLLAPAPGDRSLEIMLRDSGDLELEFHVPGLRGSPFNWLYDLAPEHECWSARGGALAVSRAERIALVAADFCDVIDEVLVAAPDGPSPHTFQAPSEVAPRPRGGRVRSWRATYDRD